MAFDPFKLESGLLGNVDVKITDAEFINDPAYNNGQTLQLSLTMQVQGDDGGEKVENFSCGDGWETVDGGKTAVREDGKERNFNGQSTVGLFFGGLVDVMGEDAKADKAIRAHIKNFPLGPREAAFWKGLEVHIDRIEKDYGGEIGKRDKLVIDGFAGISGGGGGKAKGAEKATKAAGKSAGKAKKEEGDGGIDPAVRAKLDEIADESESHDDFMERAFAEVPEASTDEAVKAAIAQDEDVEGSIWADAMARYEAQAAEAGD